MRKLAASVALLSMGVPLSSCTISQGNNDVSMEVVKVPQYSEIIFPEGEELVQKRKPIITLTEVVVNCASENNCVRGLTEEASFTSTDLLKYQGWIKKALADTQKQYTLLVDKAAHTLDVYLNGTLQKTYNVNFGWNPWEDKVQEGDGTTPEGIYKIRSVHCNSSFHEGLHLDYPNAQDTKEFLDRRRKGILSEDASIGGAIFIHGSGDGKGRQGSDWTAGCIAMKNSDIDDLYTLVGFWDDKCKKSGTFNQAQIVVLRYGTRTDYVLK
jgi:murein L,D-transpeptidase YafK